MDGYMAVRFGTVVVIERGRCTGTSAVTTQDSTQGGSATLQYFTQVVCCAMCG